MPLRNALRLLLSCAVSCAYVFLLRGSPFSAALLFIALNFLSLRFCAASFSLVLIACATRLFVSWPHACAPGAFTILLALLAFFFARNGGLADPEILLAPESSIAERACRILRAWLPLICILVLASALFRPFDPANSLGLGAFLLLLNASARTASNEKRAWRSIMAKTFLFILSTALSLLLLDLAARAILPLRPIPGITSVPHPKYLHLLRPNSQAKMLLATGDNQPAPAYKVISSQGIRDTEFGPKAPNEFRILMLGDSYTLGHAVPLEQSIPKQTEELLKQQSLSKRITVINCGIGGAGPIQELGMLIERGLPLQPDLVVYQAFEGNDIGDCLQGVRKLLRSYNVGETNLMGYMQDWSMPRFLAELAVLRTSRLYLEIVAATGERKWILELINACRLFPKYETPVLPPSEPRPFFQEQNLATWYPELEEGMKIFEDYLRQIRDECKQREIDIVAYCVPDLATVDDAKWNELQAGSKNGNAYERGKAIKRIDDAFDRLEIPRFSVYDVLHDKAPTKETYFQMDRHLTARGNLLIAERIRDYLMNTYFPTKGLVARTTAQ